MTDKNALPGLAERLREMAIGTQQPHYTNLLRTTRELKTYACALQAGHLNLVPANDLAGDNGGSRA